MTALQCVDKCPTGYFRHADRRCITDVECWNLTKPFTSESESSDKSPFIPFNGLCATSCPDQHSAADVDGSSGRRTCKPCQGKCRKECHGSTIENISAAQQYRECAYIIGSLSLQIRQGGRKLNDGNNAHWPFDEREFLFYSNFSENVVKELEHALSNIEEIEGSLKITRSFPLVSLSFFRKLRRIHGKKLPDSYALSVMDNQNLQSLFDHEVTIEKGRIFFHFNPKLCYDVIDGLRKNITEMRGIQRFAVEDVAPNSNGDKVACKCLARTGDHFCSAILPDFVHFPGNLAVMNASIVSVAPFGAIIEVQTKVYDDVRVLLGYVLYFKPAPYQNVTLYDNRDACGGDGWKIEDMSTFDRKATKVQIVMTNLKPYTQYAYYVKTYTISTEPTGGQTKILYFTTAPWQPGPVQKMKVTPNGSSSFVSSETIRVDRIDFLVASFLRRSLPGNHPKWQTEI